MYKLRVSYIGSLKCFELDNRFETKEEAEEYYRRLINRQSELSLPGEPLLDVDYEIINEDSDEVFPDTIL